LHEGVHVKFGAIPTNLAERLALAAGRVPVPAIDAMYGLVKARALMAGVRLGVFAALGDGRRTAADLAGDLHLDAEVLELLLRTLAVAGYVAQRGDRYTLTALARRTLVPGSPHDLHGFVLWNYTQWELLEHLEEALRTGRGVDFHATLADPEAWGHYERGMMELARFDSRVVSRLVPVPRGARELLDAGGGHGLFAAAICRRHPPLRATVLELPAAVEAARALAREAGHADLVRHRAGDLRTDTLGSDLDVVLLCNVLHHFAPDAVASILGRVRRALRPSGVVAIWEIERPRRGTKATDGDGAALYFRITSTAGAYHGDEFAKWLRREAFDAIRVRRPLLSPGNVLVTARAES
jgi:2-polyprenyl-3-methyl-5-hydroxy-6-metoxy-1,4-benzoquinol methylase